MLSPEIAPVQIISLNFAINRSSMLLHRRHFIPVKVAVQTHKSPHDASIPPLRNPIYRMPPETVKYLGKRNLVDDGVC